mgnify:CR=1 FL=1
MQSSETVTSCCLLVVLTSGCTDWHLARMKEKGLVAWITGGKRGQLRTLGLGRKGVRKDAGLEAVGKEAGLGW